jgi:hypothetical protein
MQYLLETSAAQSAAHPFSPNLVILVIIGIVGFVASAVLGSIAWYNSKRPQGWQDKERPDFVPEVEK